MGNVWQARRDSLAVMKWMASISCGFAYRVNVTVKFRPPLSCCATVTICITSQCLWQQFNSAASHLSNKQNCCASCNASSNVVRDKHCHDASVSCSCRANYPHRSVERRVYWKKTTRLPLLCLCFHCILVPVPADVPVCANTRLLILARIPLTTVY